MRRRLLALLLAPAAAGVPAVAVGQEGRIGPDLQIVNLGRHLTPYGRVAAVGNFAAGGAVTPDGRFYWTVSAGAGLNDVRIVSTSTAKVVQVIPLPGASGGVAIDPRGGRAYVSGLADSTNRATTRPKLPGGEGDVVHVFRYARSSGKAKETGRIKVPAPSFAAPPQQFPLPADKKVGYPEKLAVSPDGRRLLVALGLANAAAIADTRTRRVRYVPVGRYPYGAAITPDGRRGLISNEASGTVSVLDLRRARKIRDIAAGGHLAHPEAIVAPAGTRAYVTITNLDQIGVIDLRRLRVVRRLPAGAGSGLGASPNALAVAPGGRRLLAALSGADVISAWRVPRRGSTGFRALGRIPTARYPTDVQVTGGAHPKLVWLSAKGLGVGPNPKGPNPFNSATLDQTAASDVQFLPRITEGAAGIGALPSDARLKALTRQADAQVPPANLPPSPPADTPVRAGGPIRHVFYIVRENRTYDQVLGDDPRGDGDPRLTLFGEQTTPNLHALVQRFPLVDHVYADSEASQQGHQWTSAGTITDFTERNWQQISSPFGSYGARGRPLEPGFLAVTWPQKGYIFDQALRQGVSFFNYGEAFAGDIPLPNPALAILAKTQDRDRSAADRAAVQAKFARSDFGPGVGGCFPNVLYAAVPNLLTGKEVFDATPPPGAPDGSESRAACFRQRFAEQLAAGDVPALSYITLPNDHTRGLTAGSRTPQAFIADNDLGTAQIIDTISHSPIWPESAVFVVEDDSQDGADHVDAHRIPALVASPYAKAGAVVHTRYDQLSVLRTIELILGLDPLSLNDALATPMYDAFDSTPANLAPYDALPETQDLLATNPHSGPGARASARLDFAHVDAVPQHDLDNLLWRGVHGWRSTPPPPGPGAATPARELDERLAGVRR
ncbi:MAG TPA: bifunctional YncE family protein/alkaline phosphatase family protein [Solirubrobacteraceae bacterium]